MQESSDSVPLRMCTSCGSIQEREGHFCEKCGAPLTQHAHSDYVLGIQSRGFARHKATTDPQKMIVVIGTWLWLAPTFAIFLFQFLVGLVAANQEPRIAGGMLMAFGAAGMLLFGTILYRTTFAWLGQRASARGNAAFESDDEDSEPHEQQECLECGKPFAASLPRCPACGWTYQVENPDEGKTKSSIRKGKRQETAVLLAFVSPLLIMTGDNCLRR